MTLSYTVHVDWNADGDYSDANENITEYVKDWSVTLGVQDPRARVADVGTLTLTVDNQTKLFSPAYSSGALYGKLLPGKPVRVQVTDGVTTWTAFRGITRAFRPTSGAYGERTATIECADLMQVLQDQTISLPLQEDKGMGYLLKLISASTWRTARATGTLTFSGLPADGDTFTINGTAYRWKTAIAQANDVLIGATIEDCVDNAVAAVNGGAGSGTAYYAGTTRPANVVAEPQPTYYRQVMADGPVRYYRLGEAAGTSAADSGSNGANGTYVNTPTLGATGALTNDPDDAVTLNGTDEYVSVPTLDLTGSYTVECWANASDLSAIRTILGIGDADVSGELIDLRITTAGKVQFLFGGASVIEDGTVTTGAWHHYAATYNDASNDTFVYVDTVKTNAPGVAFTAPNPTIKIGDVGAFALPFAGTIDEVAIYWRVLTEDEIVAHYAARAVAPGVLFSANARGAWGNALTLAESGTNTAVSGATFSGGADGPAGLYSFEDGRETFDVAGDLWSTGETNGLDAVTDVVMSEYGLFWGARDGTLTAKDRDWEFEQHAQAPALTLSSQHNALEWADEFDLLANRVVVSFTPRGELSSGVVARAKSIITVPPRAGNERWNPSSDLDKSGYLAPDAGLFVTTLPYVDTGGGGKLIGAKDLTLPLVPSTDYTAGDRSDGTDESYTTYAGLKFSLAATGSGIEVSIRNDAIGPLYVKGLRVRGVGMIAYDVQRAIIEDADSMDAYGRRAESVDLPLASSSTFAYALASYLLSRHKTPTPRVAALVFTGQTSVGAVELFSIDIGETITVTDAQTGVSAQRYLVTGIGYDVAGGVPMTARITFYVRRLDDAPYLILDDATYGKIGTGVIAL